MKSHRNRFGKQTLIGKTSRRVSVFKKFARVHLENLEMRALLTASPLLAQWENLSNADVNETLPAARSILASSCAGHATNSASLTNVTTVSAGQDLPTAADVPTASPQTVDEVFAEPLIEGQVAEFKLVAEDLNGNLITSINVGQNFKLAAYVEDLRDPPNQLPGVWAAFMNVVYTSNLVTITPGGNPPASDQGNNSDLAFEWGEYFATGLRTGDLDTDGQIVGAGSSSLKLQAAGTGEKLLFRVVVHADAAGTVLFEPSFDSAPNHDSSFLNPTDVFTAANINFLSAQVEINGPPTVSIAPTVSQNEGNSGTTNYFFTVTLSDPATQQTTVAFATGGGTATAGQDYTGTSGTLTFGVGDTSKVITVVVAGDTTNEVNEDFTVTLSNPVNAVLATAVSGVGTIVNDDSSVISIQGVSKVEGNAQGTMVFTVNLSAPSATAVLVPWNTENVVGGNAATGSSDTTGDYQHTSGTLTFGVGNTTQFITVVINGDTTNEANEDFRVVLTQPANATFDSSNGQALGTILNDDGPNISITQSVTHAEGNSGTVAYVFTVDIGQASDVPITVQFGTQGGTAIAGQDYTGTSGTLTFLPDDPLTQQITVLVNGDALNEANETFQLKLSNPTGSATLTSDTGTGTIENDDAVPTVTLSSSTVTLPEGDSEMFFTVNLSAASGQQVLVQFATSNGSATVADNDYTATSGTLTFAAGETQKIVTVLIKADTKDEANETFSLTLSAPTNATLGTPVVSTGTIEDNDAAPTASIGNASIAEGNSGEVNLVFTVTLSAVSGQAITIPWSTADDTATVADNDYTATSGTLTIAAGQTSGTITVKVKGDTKNEPNEVFKVNLNSTGATNVTIADGAADGTITNDEALPTVSITNGTPKSEGNSGETQFFFTVNLSAASSQSLSVAFTTVDGSATTTNDDYVAQNGTLTFLAGETQKVITISVKGDTRFESDETFNVVISNPSAGMSLGQSSGQGLILNDDEKPTLSIADVSKLEGDTGTTDFVFQVTLSSATGVPVTVVYTTSNGTATTGNSDYTATSGTLTFAAGVTTQSITVKVIGDKFQEPNETFTVTLSSPNANATIADGSATGTIQNEAADNIVHQPSTIRGFAFLDTNGNNVKDGNEKPMAGAKVTLEGVSSLTSEDVIQTTFTLADGSYSFENIDAGEYQVTFEDLLDFQHAKVIENSAQLAALPGSTTWAAYSADLVMPGGFNILDANFASAGYKPGRISQRLYLASSMGSSSSTGAPTVALSTVTTAINATNAANTTVSGTGTVGATISVFASNNGTNSATKTTTVAANGTWSITGIDVSSLADGTITYTATATNGNGTSSSTKTTTKDANAPAVSLTTVTTPINGSNFNNASASGTGEVGATISVTATDGTNTTPAVTTTVGSNGTWSVTGLNLSNLKDGTISYTAKATDGAGNSAQSTMPGTKAALVVDMTTAPAINNANKANLSVSGTGQSGTTVTVTVTDGTNTSVAKTAVVAANGSWTVTGIDATSLTDGNVTYKVVATNPAGDSVEDTQTATKDVLVPAVTIAAATAPINAANVANTSANGTGEVGATITVTVTDGITTITAPTTQVAGDGTWSITGLNLSTLQNGNIAYQVRATDAAGNSNTLGPAFTIATFKDVVVPTVTLGSFTESINLGNQADVTASGTIGSGETRNTTINLVISDGTNTVTKSVTIPTGTTAWSITDIDVSGLADGTLTFTVTATDEAGNVSAADSDTATKAGLVVSEFTSAVNIDNEDAAAISGTGQVGATISVTVTDGVTTTTAVTMPVAANGTWAFTGIDLSDLADGEITYTVTATSGGQTATVTKEANKDTTAPPVTLVTVPQTINNTTQNSITVSGTGEVGTTVSVTVTDGVTTTTAVTAVVAAGGTWSISGINVSALADGDVTITAIATDGVGNTSTPSSLESILDTVAPLVAITTVDDPLPTANLANLSASGTGEVGATVSVVARNGAQSSTPVTAVVAGDGTWTVTGINVTGLADGTITFAVTATDEAGNVSAEDTITAVKDTTPPAVTGLTVTTPINASNFTATSISGTSEEGATIKVTVTDGTTTTQEVSVVVGASGNWTISGIDLTSLDDGEVTYSVTGTDEAGNVSAAVTKTSLKDTVAPPVAMTTVTEVINNANASNLTASGTGEEGTTVSVVASDGTTTTVAFTAVVGTGGTWTVTGINVSGLDDGAITFTATAVDAVGNQSTESSLERSKDTQAPLVDLVSVTPGTTISSLNEDEVAASGTGEVGATVSLVISDGTASLDMFSVQVAGDGTWSLSGINVSTLADGTLTFTVTATDAVGNVSAPDSLTVAKDTVASVSITNVEEFYNAEEVASLTVGGVTEPGAMVSLTITNGVQTVGPQTVQAAGDGTWSISGLNITTLDDGELTFSVFATDVHGNVSPTVTDTAVKDVVAPTSALDSVTEVVNSINADASSASGTGTVGATITVTVTDGVSTTAPRTVIVGAGGTWSITDLDLSNLIDGTITYNATASDAAGNDSATSSLTADKDTVAPDVFVVDTTDPINAANQAAVGINGTGEVGATVTVVVSDGPNETSEFTVVVAGNGTWSISSIDVTALDDGLLTFLVFATDAAGNESEVEFGTSTKDTVIAVEISAVSPLNAEGIANVTVSGTGDEGDTIEVVVFDGQSTVTQSTTVAANGTWSIVDLDLSTLNDGTITFTANATDAAGNTDTDVEGSVTKDTVSPALAVTTVTDPINSANASATAISGTAEVGAHLEVVVTDGTHTVTKQLAAVDGTGNWTISDIDVSTFFDGTITYTVTATDAAGNTTEDVITATATGLPSGAPLVASALTMSGQNSGTPEEESASSDYTSQLNDHALGDDADWDVQLCELTAQMADELLNDEDTDAAAEAAADAALEQFAGLTM